MAVYDISGNVICGKEQPTYTDEQCMTAFMNYMAKKCILFGMTGTSYANPSGLSTDSLSTPQDELKLGLVAAMNPKALDIWSTPTTTFSVAGDHARTLNVERANSTYINLLATAGYTFLGGKGGSLTMDGYDRAMVAVTSISGKTVVVAVMARGQTSYNNVSNCFKEVCDMVAASLAGQTPTQGSNLNTLISNGGGYASCLVPEAPGAFVNLVTPADLLSRSNSVYNAATASRRPASTTKIMTMLCALDYVVDEYEAFSLHSSDIVGGSGSTFYEGDILTFFDALRIMMMESSNTLATAIGREIGNRILLSDSIT